MAIRKTKIICTLGPAVDDDDSVRALIQGGMNAARFNFSHGTHEEQLTRLNRFKRVRDEIGLPVATIMDTKGPEVRIRTFEDGSAVLTEGGEFILTTEEVKGDRERVSVTYDDLHSRLSPDCRILLDDGLIELNVTDVCDREIRCAIERGGVLANNKSIHIPGVPIPLPSLSDWDVEDLRFAVEHNFDFVAASFVRQASDVEDIRRVLRQFGGEDIRIIAKIENRQGVDNLEEIVAVSDGVMVARGDLGVEIPAYEVPVLQRQMIRATTRHGKPVIIATQMLDSMTRNPRATRAEVSDVANAVFDRACCVMLSGETAAGRYPLEALKTMEKTVIAAEKSIDYWGEFRKGTYWTGNSINNAINHGGCHTAMSLGAAAILTATQSGHSARMVARFRPACPIVALTPSEGTRRKLAISWGVSPYLSPSVDSTDQLFSLCVGRARSEGIVKTGDTVVITAGVPLGKSGSTNLIKAQIVGEETA